MKAKNRALFLEKIVVQLNECWLWTGYVQPQGYGMAYDGERMRLAHIVSYEMHVGKKPVGLDLDHLCRNRARVNPDHLEPVTRQENLLRGETIPARKAGQTHCGNGHPFSPENTYYGKTGRHCRVCRAELYRNWVAINRERRRELDRDHYRRKVEKNA